MKILCFGVFSALVTTPAVALTVSIIDGVPVETSLGALGFAESSSNGFVWNNGFDQTRANYSCSSNGVLRGSDAYGYYGNSDCDVTYSIRSADGSKFNLESLSGGFYDSRNWTGPGPAPDDTVDFGAFYNWAYSGVGDGSKQFRITGFSDGGLVASFDMASFSGAVDLSGFDGITSFEVSGRGLGSVYVDSPFMLPRTSNSAHCYSNCYSFGISAFSVSQVAPVPLPASALLMLFGIGAVGAVSKKRRR